MRDIRFQKGTANLIVSKFKLGLRVKFKLGLRVTFKLGLRVKFKLGLGVKFKIGLRVKFKLGLRLKFKLGLRVKFKLGLGVKFKHSQRGDEGPYCAFTVKIAEYVLRKKSLLKPISTCPAHLILYFITPSNIWGTRWRSWLRHCDTSRKVAGSISDGVIGIFDRHNPSGRIIALRSRLSL
jgi:hypothetical protein